MKIFITKKEFEEYEKISQLHFNEICEIKTQIEEVKKDIQHIKDRISLNQSYEDYDSIGYVVSFLNHKFNLLLDNLNLRVEEYERPEEYYKIPTHKAYRIEKLKVNKKITRRKRESSPPLN
jgi:hypothetical protein